VKVLRLLFPALRFVVLSIPALNGQETKPATAPVPSQILIGKTVFISNAGGDTLGPDFFNGLLLCM
jgi:hypothetical protein